MRSVTPILRPAEIIETMYQAVQFESNDRYKAFFSSELGGITTEPMFMMIHLDDHMVNRGHSVFEISLIEQGYIYLFEQHLEQFFKSAMIARIPLTFPKEKIRKIILETCAASNIKNGEVRFWLSAGRGGFALTSRECYSSSFYVQVIEKNIETPDFTERWRVITSSVPSESGILAKMKTNCNLANALSLIEAEEQNAHQGIFLDTNGYVSEGSDSNLLLYTGDNRLLIPLSKNCVIGCTINRLAQLVKQFLVNDSEENRKDYEWLYENINSVEFIPAMRPTEIQALAKEIFLIGSSVVIIPVYKWDEDWIGDQFVNTSSELYQVLFTIIRQDMIFPGYDSRLLTPFYN